jgi:hypothetical protein
MEGCGMSQFVIYRGGWKSDYQLARIGAKTPKLYKLADSTGFQRQIGHNEAVLILDDAEEAARLYQELLGFRKECEAAVNAAHDRYRQRAAQAIEAQRAETPKSGSVHESAVPEGDVPQ